MPSETEQKKKTLKPEEFVAVSPVTGEVVWGGRECLVRFGLDPDKCVITVTESGGLDVKHNDERRSGGLYLSELHWRRVNDLTPR